MDTSQYDVIITRHAFEQAAERGIHPDMIEDAMKCGKTERFGKHGVKFASQSIICVGQITGTKIKIFTVEAK